MDFIPDSKKAREYVHKIGFFEIYSPAYIVTNENLRQLPQLMPKKHEKVLTVVGSGDHPLWFSLYGAKYVDTFDVSYNAKLVMYIKIAALNCLSLHEYKDLLDDLYELYWQPFVYMSEIKNMRKILTNLPKIESEYIESLGAAKIFRTYCKPRESQALPTFSEYIKLRLKIKDPYSFYMTDIRKLSNYLTKSYDVIHLSNILDYVPVVEHKNVILPLLNHVNPGGRIIAHSMQYQISEGYDNYFGNTAREIANSLDNWQYIQKPIYSPVPGIGLLKDGTHILERIR